MTREKKRHWTVGAALGGSFLAWSSTFLFQSTLLGFLLGAATMTAMLVLDEWRMTDE